MLRAWQSWRNAKAVAFLAAAALAIGIGAATTIYTVVNSVMLKPLPYRDGDRFVTIFGAAVNEPERFSSLSFSDARTYQERTQAFDAFGWFRSAGKNMIAGGQPHHVEGISVTSALAHQFGVEPMLGQWFHDDTGVVISAPLWRRLGSDAGIVGRSVTLDGRAYVVTGVMPGSFKFPVAGIGSAGARTDVWLALDPTGRGEPDAGVPYFAYARRKPGMTVADAEADVKRVAAEIAAEDPLNHPAYTARVLDLQETVIRDIRPTLLLLLTAAALLFLIACANAAWLLLARSVARARETATRVALGANRSRLAAQYFAESLPVALAGAGTGIVLSLILTPSVVAIAGSHLPRAEEIATDWTVLSFAVGAAMLAAVLSSLAPLWLALRTSSAEVLGEGTRTSAGARSRRVSQVLVVAQVALAFTILAASALLIGHLRSLSRTPSGLDPDHVLTFVASVPDTIAADDQTRVPFQRRLLAQLQAVPGVDAVAFASQLPLDGCCLTTTIYPDGRPAELMAGQRTGLMGISPDYFRAMGIPLRRGRLLDYTDLNDDRAVVVISQSAADRYWGGQDPLDVNGRFGNPTTGSRFQVVGIVGDVRNDGLNNPSVPDVYVLAELYQVDTMHLVVRSARPAESLLPDIRRAIGAVDPALPIHQVATMPDIIRESVALERAASFMTALFAAAALVLATLGIYGVVAYVVRQRRVEIGTRMALGATSQKVLSLILAGGLKLATAGVIVGGAVGIGAALYLARVFEIGDVGLAPFLSATAVVSALALVASAAPAWRASLLSPMVAIRETPESVWLTARQHVGRAVQRFSGSEEEGAAVALGTLIGEFADAAHRARSARDATGASLTTLQDRTGASSVVLLERTDDEYRSGTYAIPARGLLANRLRSYRRALTLSHFGTWLRWARASRPEHIAEIETLAAAGVQVAVPLRSKNEIVGVLLLGPPAGREQYTAAERQVLSQSADVLALMLENARLTDREVEQEVLRRDVAMAAEVQKRLLPPQPPRSANATFAAFTLPARTVGGDYYDFLDLGDERIGLAVADVSGKGVPAALLMSVVQASLRVISTEQDLPLSHLASKMNRFLYQSTGANRYATFFYAQIEDNGRRLRYVNAGHNPPYLVRRSTTGADADIVELGTGGTVLGLFPDVDYEEGLVDLRAGDVVVAFTDGVTDALDSDGNEFGEERVKDVLRAAAGAPAHEVSARLADAMRAWIGRAEQYDDLTFVVVSVREPAESI